MDNVNIKKVTKLADRIIDYGVPKNYFEEHIEKLDVSKITRSILNNIKTLTKEEKDCLDLVISVRGDHALNNMRVMLREELEPIKKDIRHIKKVVGCNGDA